MDFSQATDDELNAKLEGIRPALGAPLGRPYDGREEHKNTDLQTQAEVIEAELNRRNATGS